MEFIILEVVHYLEFLFLTDTALRKMHLSVFRVNRLCDVLIVSFGVQ